MESQAADPRVAAALDQIRAGLDALAEVGPVLVDVADARVVIREAEELARRQRAFQIDLLAEVERRGLHRLDGHASAKVLVRHVAQLSAAEASRRAKAAEALQDLPEVAAAYRAGAVGSCHVDRIARAHANPRVRPALADQDAALAVGAAGRAYSVFDGWVTDWVRR